MIDWISVDERLPNQKQREEEKQLLICIDCKEIYFGRYDLEGCWFVHHTDGFEQLLEPGIDKVTHWAEINEPESKDEAA
jgi:hypothetical protein